MPAVLNAAQVPVPINNVAIDGISATLVPSSLTLSQVPGQHENAQLTILMPTLDPSQFNDKSISFTWGPHDKNFAGYIRSVTQTQDQQSQTYLELDCYGPSWEMRDGMPHFFQNISGPDIVKLLASKNGLGCIADPHPFIFSKVAQTTESDWGFANSIANAIGYYLVVVDGVIRLMDPVHALDVQGPVLNLAKAQNQLTNQQLLLSFTSSSVVPTDRTIDPPKMGYFREDKSVGFINPDAEMFTADTYIPDSNWADLVERVTIKAIDSWIYSATAQCKGNSSLHPGQTVTVITGGSDALTNTGDGLWFIESAIQSLNSQTFQTQLGLRRDANRFSTLNTGTFWGGPNYTQPTLTRVNGRWISSLR